MAAFLDRQSRPVASRTIHTDSDQGDIVTTKTPTRRPLLAVTFSTLGAVLGLAGISICPTTISLVPSAGASPATPHNHAATEVRGEAASALTSSKLDLTTNASYACVSTCASATYFWINGVAHSGSTTFGRISAVGTVLSVLKNGCLAQSEHYGLTEQSGPHDGDTFWFSTTSDHVCPTKNPNVTAETGSFTITGGTGVFKGATGQGSFTWSVLANPQTGSGTLTASISY